MNNKGGRPEKFPDSIENIIEGIRKGLTLKAACRYAGVSYSALAYWMSKGKQSQKTQLTNKYTIVLDRIDQATRAQKQKHHDDFF